MALPSIEGNDRGFLHGGSEASGIGVGAVGQRDTAAAHQPIEPVDFDRC